MASEGSLALALAHEPTLIAHVGAARSYTIVQGISSENDLYRRLSEGSEDRTNTFSAQENSRLQNRHQRDASRLSVWHKMGTHLFVRSGKKNGVYNVGRTHALGSGLNE